MTDIKNFSCALGLTKGPSIQGKVLLAEPKDAGFSFSHDIYSHLASLSIAGNSIPTPDPAVEEGKALCAPDNLNASAENQGQMKMCISQVCRENVSLCCNSFLQQAGLNLLISMTVINNLLAKSVSGLMFPLIAEGSECAEGQVVKPLTGLSEKPALSGELQRAQVLCPFLPLFIRNTDRQLLSETLAS
ncbi:protein ARMCX6-like [Moschus berezovskii]|uniref:protein ARMCX6-like n=1 Tax=Moschus berezovskii TaxID=68408 RepID=UPI002444BDEA|nr:protein ARMCX6-like [Moschus berezovskii]